MLVFAAHIPHSPLLIPSVSGDRIGAVTKTRDAVSELAGLLYVAKPDTILLISDHPSMFADAFSIAVADPYVCSLRDVGDLGYSKTYHPDFSLIDRLQRDLRSLGEPITLTTDPELHFSATVPLELLTAALHTVRIVPISPSTLSPKAHFTFGQSLKHTLIESHKRIAIISSGDGAQTLTAFAPGGFHEDGVAFQQTLRTCIAERNVVGLMQMDETLLMHAQESLYRKLLILLGALDGMALTPEIMSDESPFGIGYLVVNFPLT